MLLGKAYSGWGNHSGEALEVYGELIAKYPDDFRSCLTCLHLCWPHVQQ